MRSPFAVLQQLREGLETRLFDPGPSRTGPLARLLHLLGYPYAVLRDLLGGQLTLRATGLVYATLLSIVPAIALSFALLKAFGIHRDLAPIVQEFFRPLGSSADQITARVFAFAERVRGGLVGSVGFLVLLWTLIGTVKRVEDSFNYVWRVQVARSYARRVAESAALLVAAPVLIVSVVAFTKLAVDGVTNVTPGDVPLLVRVSSLVITLAPYAIVTILFMMLYVVLPNTRVRPGPALIGALCAGVLWALVGKLFTQLVLYSSRLTLVYAGFAVIVAVLLWTYFGWLILLAGAQLSFYVQNPSYLRLGLAPVHLSNREKERVALNLMVLVAEHSGTAGARAVTLDRLARTLGLPGIVVAPVFVILEEAGLIGVGEHECVALTRPADTITLAEIIAAVRQRRRGHRLLRVDALPGVRELQDELEQTVMQRLGSRTLADWLAARGPARG